MDWLTILLIVLIVLALGGWGAGAYAGGGNPLVHMLGVLGLLLIVALVVMLATGWRFGVEIAPPGMILPALPILLPV